MSGFQYTILGAASAAITFLLGAQASGAAGIEALPPIAWLGMGAINAAIGFVMGYANKGTTK